jgi:hypothetical protein
VVQSYFATRIFSHNHCQIIKYCQISCLSRPSYTSSPPPHEKSNQSNLRKESILIESLATSLIFPYIPFYETTFFLFFNFPLLRLCSNSYLCLFFFLANYFLAYVLFEIIEQIQVYNIFTKYHFLPYFQTI